MQLPRAYHAYAVFRAESYGRVCSFLLTAGFVWTMLVTGLLKPLPKLL